MTVVSTRLFFGALALSLLVQAPLRVSASQCADLFADRTATHTSQQIAGYLSGTKQSLEQMRGENALVADMVEIKSAANGTLRSIVINPNTSPTNIAVDLLVQVELAANPLAKARALKNISGVLGTLETLNFHQATGLFFSRYVADKTSAVADMSVSSIDNLHLAISLFTIRHEFAGTEIGDQAGRLYDRMDFSAYYNEATGLIGGNLSYRNGKWTRDTYDFANLGSEARLLYSAGWAMGLFKDQQGNANFISRALANIKAEVLSTKDGDILKLWDGSAFQMYFPKMFINEELYSASLKKMYLALADYMVAEGTRRQLVVPAAHSPGVVPFAEAVAGASDIKYKDKSGIQALVCSDNNDLKIPDLKRNWDSTFTPYAFFMASTSNPSKFMPLLDGAAKLMTGNQSLYSPLLGWMDGYEVTGVLKGEVVPAQLSLNQGMIALSLLQMQKIDGLSASSRALFADPIIKARLMIFYQLFDRKLKEVSLRREHP